MEERREGRERLQKVAALVMLRNLCAVPTAQRLPQTPAAALALGVLESWRSYCQVCLPRRVHGTRSTGWCLMLSCRHTGSAPERVHSIILYYSASKHAASPSLSGHCQGLGRQNADEHNSHAVCVCICLTWRVHK